MDGLGRSHYQLLLALERLGSVGQAATELHISQSAASQRINEAERRLGITLTTRSGRNVALTSAALLLIQAARQSEALLQAAEAEARWLDHSNAPTLTLAVGAHDALWWLPALSTELDADDDCAAVEVVRCTDDDGPRFVADGRADIHITPYETTSKIAQTLFKDQLVGVVGTNHALATKPALTPHDYHSCHYATYSNTPRDGFEHHTFLAPHGAIPATITRYESISTIVAIVAAGNRISILPRWAIPDDPSVTIKPLDPAPPAITWTLLTRDSGTTGAVGRARDRLIRYLPGLTHSAT
jgi:LysR family transcriptional regulator, regulator for metE and metH